MEEIVQPTRSLRPAFGYPLLAGEASLPAQRREGEHLERNAGTLKRQREPVHAGDHPVAVGPAQAAGLVHEDCDDAPVRGRKIRKSSRSVGVEQPCARPSREAMPFRGRPRQLGLPRQRGRIGREGGVCQDGGGGADVVEFPGEGPRLHGRLLRSAAHGSTPQAAWPNRGRVMASSAASAARPAHSTATGSGGEPSRRVSPNQSPRRRPWAAKWTVWTNVTASSP